jgi:hypothetical protein
LLFADLATGFFFADFFAMEHPFVEFGRL